MYRRTRGSSSGAEKGMLAVSVTTPLASVRISGSPSLRTRAPTSRSAVFAAPGSGSASPRNATAGASRRRRSLRARDEAIGPDIGDQRFRQDDGTVGLLPVLEQGDDGSR